MNINLDERRVLRREVLVFLLGEQGRLELLTKPRAVQREVITATVRMMLRLGQLMPISRQTARFMVGYRYISVLHWTFRIHEDPIGKYNFAVVQDK